MPPVDAQVFAIRAATPSDAPAIGRVHVQGWQETYGRMLSDGLLASVSATVRAAMWRGGLDAEPPILLYVAERTNGELVGFAGGGARRGSALPHDAEIYAIYVVQAAQNRGCGRRLLAALGNALLARGYTSLCLWVLEENAGARRFYERLGGAVVGEKPEVDGEPASREIAYGWNSLAELCSTALEPAGRH